MSGTTQTASRHRGTGIFTLLGRLQQDLLDVVKEEINLFKTEMTAKASCLGKHAAMVAVGGFVAYTGAVLLLIGVGAFIAFGLQHAGLSPMLSIGIAFAAFGALVGIGGFILLKSALSTLSEASVTPTETLATVKEFAKGEAGSSGLVASSDLKTESGEKTQKARAAVEAKRERAMDKIAEVQHRLTPQYILGEARSAINRRPAASASIGAAAVALGYVLIRRRRRKADRAPQRYEVVLD